MKPRFVRKSRYERKNWYVRKKMQLLLLIVALLSLVACNDDMTPGQRWLATTTEQIQRGYQQLSAQTHAQQQAADAFCQHPDVQGLQTMQAAWRESMAAWQQIQWLRIGPIAQDNDDWKLQFWPDKKNILQRKMQDILDGSEPVSADSLVHASVVVQGFSAQELLLFDPQFAAVEKFAGRQCDLLRASTTLTAQVGQKLADAWQDETWLKRWVAPAATQVGLAPAHVRNGEILDALLAQIERIKNDKLGEPMGLKTRDKKPNGYFAESWRSENSLANLQNNLLAVQQLIRPAQGYGLFQYLKDSQQQALADEMVIKLDNAQQALQQIRPPLTSAVTDAAQQPALQNAHRALGELATFCKQKLAPALGLTLGFNSNDGD